MSNAIAYPMFRFINLFSISDWLRAALRSLKRVILVVRMAEPTAARANEEFDDKATARASNCFVGNPREEQGPLCPDFRDEPLASRTYPEAALESAGLPPLLER